MTQDITYFESGYIDNTYFVYTADVEAHLTVSSSIRAFVPNQPAVTQTVQANLISYFSITRAVLDGTTRYIDPYIISGSNYGGIGFDSTIKKFGASLRFDARSIGATVDLGPVFANGQFIALNASDSGSNYTMISTDGVSWTTVYNNLPTRDPFLLKNFLKYLNNQWVTNIGTNFYTSTDAVTWTTITNTVDLIDITYTGNYYLGINTGTAPSLTYSTNLSTWTPKNSYTNQTINRGIKSLPVSFVDPVSGYNTLGYLNIALGHVVDGTTSYGPTINFNVTRATTNYSTVGTAKTKGISGYPIINATYNQTRQTFLDAATDGTNIILVGTDGIICTVPVADLVNNTVYNQSVNNIDLTQRTSPTTEDIVEIKFLNGLFIGRTITGKVLHSYGGITWPAQFVPTLSSPTTTTPWIDGTVDIPVNQFNTSVSYGNNKWIAGAFISPDAVNWSRIDFIGQIANQQPSVYYEPGQYLNAWRTLDFWLYVTPSDLKSLTGILWQGELNSNASMAIMFDTNNGALTNYSNFSIFESDSNGDNLGTYTVDRAFVSGQWNHIRVVHDSGLGAIFVNGYRVQQFTPQGTLGFDNTPMYIGRYVYDVRYARSAYYIDEFLLTKDLLSLPTDTSYTVPTTPWTNGSNVLALLHFNNDIDDDNLPWNGAALTSTCVVTTQLSKIQKTQAVLTSTSSLSARVINVKTFADLMVDNFTLTATANRIRTTKANLVVTSQLTAVDRVTDSVQAHLSAVSQITINAKRSSSIGATLTSTSQLTAAVNKIKNGQANLSSSSSFTADYNRYRLVTATGNFNSHSTVQLTATKIGSLTAHLSDTTRLFAQIDNIATTKNAQANLFSYSTFTASGGLTGYIDTNIAWIIPTEDRDWTISKEI